MRCDLVQKLKPKTYFLEKRIRGGFWGKIEQSFHQEQFCPRTHHVGPEKSYGPGFIKKFRLKTCFLGWTKLRSRTLFPQSRNLVRLAKKIGEVRFSTKIQTENVFYGKTNSRGLLKPNWAKFSSGTITPPNAPYRQLGPEKRYGADFIKKFHSKTCFFAWTKLRSGPLLPPIAPSSPFGQENRWSAI